VYAGPLKVVPWNEDKPLPISEWAKRTTPMIWFSLILIPVAAALVVLYAGATGEWRGSTHSSLQRRAQSNAAREQALLCGHMAPPEIVNYRVQISPI
jgi:hypothetical protein